ncbi:MAG: DUF2325 domain-containing protein [Hyphomicrobiaceae bacterium]|nr:DUF2325 domain-containing protein [Hyphomicrobiaceae bacterium]
MDGKPIATRRKKLWEIEECYHCSILGTCLSMRDLEKIGPKTKIRFKPGASEYIIHGTFVTCVKEHSDVARVLHRALDRKYRTAIDQLKKVTCRDDLRAYWQDNLKRGNVPSAFWAVMSHPLADGTFSQEVFGEVHMLSHMVGSANREALQRLDQLEAQSRAAAVAMDEERLRHRRLVDERNAMIADLRSQLEPQAKLKGRLVALEAQVAQLESNEGYRNLKTIASEQTREAAAKSIALRRADKVIATQKAKIRKDEAEIRALRRALDDSRARVDRVERFLESELFRSFEGALFPAKQKTASDLQAAGEVLDLDGATIVYIGGHKSKIRHIRTFVECANGEFIHHDGGLEESDMRLSQILGRGDFVMCPIDCISHNACLRAKKFCKHAGKNFVPLRGTGLSCFVTSLHEVVSSGDQH